MNYPYTDATLMYAATARCALCNAGLAYPLDPKDAFELGAWVCSSTLKGAEDPLLLHTRLPFAFWKVREETSINNYGSHTTRPEGTQCLTVGHFSCPNCTCHWHSQPYSACGKSHHEFSGPCPACGYAVGADGLYSSSEGEPIDSRYGHVVLFT